jgi:hypothetical protein
MEFQVHAPMKLNLKSGLVFSVAHFSSGATHRSRYHTNYSIRISESGPRTLPDGNRNAAEHTRRKKKHGDNLAHNAFAAGAQMRGAGWPTDNSSAMRDDRDAWVPRRSERWRVLMEAPSTRCAETPGV